MIVDGRASLSILSDLTTAAQISTALGIEPTHSHEVGEPRMVGSGGRPLEPAPMTYDRTQWRYDVSESAVDSDDQTGSGSLSALVDRFRGKAAALAALRATCETTIWWYGSSDSSQGGFVMTARLLSDLADLGCDLFGTTYFDDPV